MVPLGIAALFLLHPTVRQRGRLIAPLPPKHFEQHALDSGLEAARFERDVPDRHFAMVVREQISHPVHLTETGFATNVREFHPQKT